MPSGRRELLKVLALRAQGIPIRIGAVKTQHSGVSEGKRTEIAAGTYSRLTKKEEIEGPCALRELIHVVNVDTKCKPTNILRPLRKVIGGVGSAENGIRPLPEMSSPLALLWHSEI
ncbi:hypothetical protein VNO77_23194 [Canavalia gladiata]|uniref:Uncharacterized protein n=1 Tax=Canavalia gladiata TaxID=3824 RepID=A0AAN9L7E8_CANGL